MAELRTVEHNNISHVVLDGRLDIEGVQQVELRLIAHTVGMRRPAIVDMSGVEFLGSLGIGVLVRCAVSMQRSGARIALFGCQPMIRKSLEMTKVTGLLVLADSAGSALDIVTAR